MTHLPGTLLYVYQPSQASLWVCNSILSLPYLSNSLCLDNLLTLTLVTTSLWQTLMYLSFSYILCFFTFGFPSASPTVIVFRCLIYLCIILATPHSVSFPSYYSNPPSSHLSCVVLACDQLPSCYCYLSVWKLSKQLTKTTLSNPECKWDNTERLELKHALCYNTESGSFESDRCCVSKCPCFLSCIISPYISHVCTHNASIFLPVCFSKHLSPGSIWSTDMLTSSTSDLHHGWLPNVFIPSPEPRVHLLEQAQAGQTTNKQ